MLAAASCRPLELVEKGERSLVVLRHFTEAGHDDVAIEGSKGESDRAGMMDDKSPDAAVGLADAERMRDAIALALALLDEMLELVPREPRQAVAQDIADIFHEISELAALGEKTARKAMDE